MYRLLLLLAPAALLAGEARYARIGEMDGKVDVQLHAADPWSRAERNLTLTENAWVRTAAGSRLEIELDEGSALRLGPDSLVELSDYSRLSTGQRITVLSLDHGMAWFTGEPTGFDSLSLSVPGAQVILSHGVRVRIEAADTFSKVAVIEGVVRLASPSAELDIRQGQTARVEQGNGSPFSLEREVVPIDLDSWSEDRDKILAAPMSASRVAMRYGVADLDIAGQWLDTELGPVWKPQVSASWVPFRLGRWRWYDSLGYTWVSDESWGWLPYHYGRWVNRAEGWVWVPPARPVFKPGDVYWLYARQIAGWGPLAPGENWTGSAAPQQFSPANTTYAAFAQDARVIDPAGFTGRPTAPGGVASLAVAALPSPAFPAWRLEAGRPMLRVGATRAIAPVVPGTVFDADAMAPPPLEIPPAVVIDPSSDAPPPVNPPVVPPILVPVPVYTDIVVINPPQHPDYGRRNPNNLPPATPPVVRGGGNPQSQPPAGRPPQPSNNPPPAPTQPPAPKPVPVAVPPKIEPPHVGVPAPQRTDRPRIEAPPTKVEQPKSPPRETPPPPRVEPPRPQPREAAPAPKAEPAKAEPAKSEPAKTDPASRKQ
jgi:hypothetical protein